MIGAEVLPADPRTPRTMTDRENKQRAIRILAKSIYRDLQAQGYDETQIVTLATELISEVTTTIARDQVAASGAIAADAAIAR